ncbi:D-alanyl-D-alanine carboxypeptidase/D-alanyl-D-alanine-endopeptidase [Comamonas sp. NLF-1-9]|uniref:D-alanyl-D-alanine carboxypeptidase/D-alanyl-D-alanine endopeptidase n=1 Tax=Comamonas sp. NLF-1-9 TaxID=2853163 RepID=UPI001C45C684|nr:D-alanyl-D-alanine carboxypeptidase/D-alanyl-D-alanine-endopeptidase [Comamonas sp. NLF-1-9]QXL83832.1 D-alanyl-D-alanine carboxypeptidase/D-alanyl-D-alanine-endopeptidase [Comamonas sp. NLF-1-9]
MSWLPSLLRRLRPALLASFLVGGAVLAATPAPAEPVHAGAQAALPAPVLAALQRAKVAPEALSAVVLPVQGESARLLWQGELLRNPASVMKLVTTYAALELLGPAYTWQTPVYVDGQVQGETLKGSVYIQGRGDPKLVVERVWLLLRRLQAQGIRNIDGDIVLDRSAFVLEQHDAGEFDGEPWRPYNVAPDALLVNFNALTLDFIPDLAAGVARIGHEPPLAGMEIAQTVPLAAPGSACGDWRAQLQADFALPGRITLAGSYPAACGERLWSVAPADPASFGARAIAGMWRALGGTLSGMVLQGSVPAGLQPAFVSTSPALSEIVRDINKYSNNVMARQLLLSLALEQGGSGTLQAAQTVLGQWWSGHGGRAQDLVLDNGAGLSREGRISALALARLLQQAWASPVMPELLASLPITGVDGTLRRRKGLAQGAGHLKTGSLRDVAAIAGYTQGKSGRRYVLVAIVNHANALAARPALDALVDWVWAER